MQGYKERLRKAKPKPKRVHSTPHYKHEIAKEESMMSITLDKLLCGHLFLFS